MSEPREESQRAGADENGLTGGNRLMEGVDEGELIGWSEGWALLPTISELDIASE